MAASRPSQVPKSRQSYASAIIDDGRARNLLIEQLSADTKTRYSHEIKKVWLNNGQRIIERHNTIGNTFFPLDCVISRTYIASCGHSAQMGMVGYGGVAGLSIFLGSKVAAYDAVVHIAGEALAINANSAKAMFEEDLEFQRAVLRYTRFMIRQISQVAVCNSLHPIEQRLSRWLLLNSVRARTRTLRITHEAVGELLSVRRESVTSALGSLQKSGIIRCDRGKIEIKNRAALEATACECYRVMKAEFDACCGYDRSSCANTGYSQ
jgi:CRP-like cAMP-binding protein